MFRSITKEMESIIHCHLYPHIGASFPLPLLNLPLCLTFVQTLLTDPNPASPANAEAATMFVNHRDNYERIIRKMIAEESLNL